MIPVARPYFGEEEEAALVRVLRSGWVTQGPEVAKLEEEFAAAVGAPHACAVSNGTTALHLALKAAGVGPGDEVITASHSFVATAAAITYLDAVPVFADIVPATFNMDPGRVQSLITSQTRALLVVHQMGMPCDLQRLAILCRRHGLRLIEDAACAAGSEIRRGGVWEPVGRPWGDVACFSFHPRKVLTSGEGGMLTTAHGDWDAKFRLWRQHGMSVPDTVRHASRRVAVESYQEIGFNYRMTDLQAAVARVQLKRLGGMVQERRRRAERYRTGLSGIQGLVLPMEPEWARSNWQSYCVRLQPPPAADRVMQTLLEEGIATRKGIMNSHAEPSFLQVPWTCGRRGSCECAPGTCRELSESERARREGVILPLYHGLQDAEQDRVITVLRAALGG